MTELSTSDRRAVLEGYDRTLGRETHNLVHRPEALWQQLYNRLQWEKEPVPELLTPELERRSAPGAAPLLRTKTRLRESEALRLTLAGRTGAISPDSDFVLTSSDDGTCKIWDSTTGRERATFAGHTTFLTAYAISPDSAFILTASVDHTCKIWDTATGQERATLRGHTDWVNACAISPDCAFVVTAGNDERCRIWDTATGNERATSTGDTAEVTACAVSPDCSLVVTVSDDGTCGIYDAVTGDERLRLPLLGGGECVALHPWRPFAVCGDAGGNVYLIDLVGIEYGPIIVTAIDLGKGAGPALRCPRCFRLYPLDDAWLGEVIECPPPDCDLSLRVNPFVTRIVSRNRPAPPAEREPQEAVTPPCDDEGGHAEPAPLVVEAIATGIIPRASASRG